VYSLAAKTSTGGLVTITRAREGMFHLAYWGRFNKLTANTCMNARTIKNQNYNALKKRVIFGYKQIIAYWMRRNFHAALAVQLSKVFAL